jgi:flagellar biosynthesis/type III secretory pathway chaperone
MTMEQTVDVQPQPINMENVMALTARLAQVLAQEADLLSEMKVKAIEPLQKEKIWLTKAMELQLRRAQKYPFLLEEISEEEREDFAELVNIFDEIRDENHRRLLAAKEVNQQMVDAIADVVNDNSRKGTYTPKGNEDISIDSMSVTLNKTI